MLTIQNLSIIVVVAPLVGSLATGLFSKFLTKNITNLISCGLVAVSFVASCNILYGLLSNHVAPWSGTLYTWGQSAHLTFNIGFLIDRLSAFMITIVSFVSLMVHIYTIGYMKDDPGYNRFFCYISFFTFAMLALVLANNFLQLFFGWEAVGLASYLLIGFWFKKESAIFANMKAFLANRVGDFGFILGIAAIAHYFGTLQYDSVFALAPQVAENYSDGLTLTCLCLFIGAMGKSAQVPLHVWLPDSMEGPTPISALIHAATMVTAGVFMVARMSPLFEHSVTILNIIIVVGSITCLFMGILGIVQKDIKRIIAYSTLSQLGYMVVALGVSAYAAGFFHLVTHAFFKALLFLGAGSVIIGMNHEQNIFKMGNLRKYMPITHAMMLIGTLALIGFPGTSGFFSKDLIIEAVHLSSLPAASLAYYVVLFSVFITSLYSFRLLFVVFYNDAEHKVEESEKVVWIPLAILAVPSVLIGIFMMKPILNQLLSSSIFVLPEHDVLSTYSNEHFHGTLNMVLHGFISMPFILALLGAVTAWACYMKYKHLPDLIKDKIQPVYKVLEYKYGFDLFNEKVLAPLVCMVGEISWRYVDMKYIDRMMVNGTANSVRLAARIFRKVQTGYLYHYTFAIISGAFLLLVWLLIVLRGI